MKGEHQGTNMEIGQIKLGDQLNVIGPSGRRKVGKVVGYIPERCTVLVNIKNEFNGHNGTYLRAPQGYVGKRQFVETSTNYWWCPAYECTPHVVVHVKKDRK